MTNAIFSPYPQILTRTFSTCPQTLLSYWMDAECLNDNNNAVDTPDQQSQSMINSQVVSSTAETANKRRKHLINRLIHQANV